MKQLLPLFCLCFVSLSGCFPSPKNGPLTMETAIVLSKTEIAIHEIVKATILADANSTPTSAPVPTITPSKIFETKPQVSVQTSGNTSDTSWFEGGTLHKASVKKWRTATYSNRLATSADFVASTQDVDFGNLKKFKNMAIALETCISTAVSGGDADTEQVAFISAICTVELFPN